jgi:hypothetical protein
MLRDKFSQTAVIIRASRVVLADLGAPGAGSLALLAFRASRVVLADLGAPGAGSLALPAPSFSVPMVAALVLLWEEVLWEEERLEPPLRASHRASNRLRSCYRARRSRP